QAHGARGPDHRHRHPRRCTRIHRRARLTVPLAERDMFDLTDNTALVTGATGGIGAAIARVLHAQGATVVLSGTRAERLEALQAELGDRAYIAACDLGDSAQVEELVGRAEELTGKGLDILVNNA